MTNAWLSYVSFVPPVPPPIVVLGEDTIRGGKLLTLMRTSDLSGGLLDTSRDQSFLSGTLPAGWTNISSGSGAVRPTETGLVLDSGATAGSVAGIETPDDYDRFDVAVDVVLVYPATAPAAPVTAACIEAWSGTDVVRTKLMLGFGNTPARIAAFGDFVIAGVTTAGGVAFAPAPHLVTQTVTIRIVRNQARIFAFAGTRDAASGQYSELVKVADYDQFSTTAGKIRLYVSNGTVSTRVRTVFTNYTVRAHCTIAGRLIDNKFDVSYRRIVGNVPAATVNDLGPVDVAVFGLFGESAYPDGFHYVLPLERTVGRRAARRLIVVQDPVLRDKS